MTVIPDAKRLLPEAVWLSAVVPGILEHYCGRLRMLMAPSGDRVVR